MNSNWILQGAEMFMVHSLHLLPSFKKKSGKSFHCPAQSGLAATKQLLRSVPIV